MTEKKTTTKNEDAVDNAAIEAAVALTDEHNQHLAEIDRQFGDGLPYERERIVHEAQFYLEQSAGAMLEAGKRLIRLKEHELHGDFTQALDDIGLAPRTARKMMQAALKYSDPSLKPLANLGKCKLLELMTEDGDELQELAEGGTLAGYTMDDIDRMPVRDLKTALRDARLSRKDDQEANDHLIQDKNKKIDTLHKKLTTNKKKAQPWDKRVEEYIIETSTITLTILQGLEQLEGLREAFTTDDFGEDNEQANEAMAVSYHDLMGQIVGRTAEASLACDEVFGGYKDAAKPVLKP